jgi:hypothetical protein
MTALTALAGLAGLLSSSSAAAACPVAAFNGTQLCNAESNALFELATGPGIADGPVMPTINDGCNKPKTPTKVPFRMPCVLAKSIGLVESSWRQFNASCGSVGPTVISFDCGYGIMQITSGMSGGAGFDPVRVANEASYNVATGLKMMGGKWAATPCVGDNEVDVMEDWYYAVWAYNGFCYCNNPNNPKFASPRPPYNGPGTLSRANYPYQEIVWGVVQYPYANTYSGQAISYPSSAAIGSTPAAIPTPTPTHSGACGPVIPAHPDLYPSVAIEGASDRFADASSQGKPDLVGDQGFTAQLYVKNQGDAVAPSVQIGVWIEEPFVVASGYEIGTDWKHPGQFTVNDANDHPDNPPHGAPLAQSFTMHLYALSPGETKRISLDMIAKDYSIGLADHPDVRIWVQDVPGFYHQDDFGAQPTVNNLQTFGSQLRAYAELDVYSQTYWGWNADLLEGWQAANAATLAVDLDEHALAVTSDGGDDPQAVGPTVAFSATTYPGLRLRAKRTGGVGSTRLYFTTDLEPAFDETKSVDVGLSSGGGYEDLTLPMAFNPKWDSTITQLRLDPFGSGQGEVLIDELRAIESLPSSEGPTGTGSTGTSTSTGAGGSGPVATGGAGGAGLGGAGGEGGATAAGGYGHVSDDEPADASGCACALPARSRVAEPGWLVAALAVGALARRRRSLRRRSRATRG